MKKIFKIALITFLSGSIFLGAAYAYLYYSVNKTTADTNKNDYTVPYVQYPKNAGIAIVFPNGNAVLSYLDFKQKCIWLLDIQNFDSTQPNYHGYTVDYTVKADYNLLQTMVDRVGGIDIKQNGQTMRYTGAQVVDLFAYGYEGEIKHQIISQIFLQISKNNFNKNDLIYLIENCESDISFIDCIYWIDYIKEMSGKVNFIN